MGYRVSDASLGYSTLLGIAASTVVKPTSGMVASVSIVVAGTTVGSVNDVATVGAAAAANAIMPLPNTVGIYKPQWQCFQGITVIPGAGQTVAIAYS